MCFASPRAVDRSSTQESNRSPELAVSISPSGPEPSPEASNRPTQSAAQPYADGDAQEWGNLRASLSESESSRTNTPLSKRRSEFDIPSKSNRDNALDSSSGTVTVRQHGPNSWVGSEHPTRCVGRPKRFNDVEFETQFRPRKLNSTQNESQTAVKSSLNSRKIQSHAHMNYRVHQPTTRVIQSGLSAASLSWSEADAVRPQTMSHDDIQFERRSSLRLESKSQPIRLVSPKVFHRSWIQWHQTRIPDDVSGDLRNEIRTSTPQGKIPKLLELELIPATFGKSNFVISDKNPPVSLVAPNQPVTHNATVSNLMLELDNSTNAPKSVSSNRENALESRDNENSLCNSDIPCHPNAEQQGESRIDNSTPPQPALSLANTTIEFIRHPNDETSSRSIVPVSVPVSVSDAEIIRANCPTNENVMPTSELPTSGISKHCPESNFDGNTQWRIQD